MSFEYICEYYNVPACIGRRVCVNGEPGIIVEDMGHYIGVNFDKDKPEDIRPAHPTWEVEYLGMGEVRKLSRGQKRYCEYLKVSDCFDAFIDFCRYKDKKDETENFEASL